MSQWFHVTNENASRCWTLLCFLAFFFHKFNWQNGRPAVLAKNQIIWYSTMVMMAWCPVMAVCIHGCHVISIVAKLSALTIVESHSQKQSRFLLRFIRYLSLLCMFYKRFNEVLKGNLMSRLLRTIVMLLKSNLFMRSI